MTSFDVHAERVLKIAQVARMANVSERTVWRDVKAGRLLVVYPFPRRPRVLLQLARQYALRCDTARQFTTST
jgi:hypothetical protein